MSALPESESDAQSRYLGSAESLDPDASAPAAAGIRSLQRSRAAAGGETDKPEADILEIDTNFGTSERPAKRQRVGGLDSGCGGDDAGACAGGASSGNDAVSALLGRGSSSAARAIEKADDSGKAGLHAATADSSSSCPLASGAGVAAVSPSASDDGAMAASSASSAAADAGSRLASAAASIGRAARGVAARATVGPCKMVRWARWAAMPELANAYGFGRE
jgi:hypothetical protein